MFLRDGFHGASLTQIAEDAGYTFGAVYSNFQNKEELFLAVLDAESQRRVPLHVDLLLDAASLEEGLRASAREYAQYAQQHPAWTAVYVEFWTHASRRPELRRQVAERHERLLDTVAGLIEEFARRWQVEFAIPAREVVRGTYALSRGMGWSGWWTPRPPRWPSSRRCSWPTRAAGRRPPATRAPAGLAGPAAAGAAAPRHQRLPLLPGGAGRGRRRR